MPRTSVLQRLLIVLGVCVCALVAGVPASPVQPAAAAPHFPPVSSLCIHHATGTRVVVACGAPGARLQRVLRDAGSPTAVYAPPLALPRPVSPAVIWWWANPSFNFQYTQAVNCLPGYSAYVIFQVLNWPENAYGFVNFVATGVGPVTGTQVLTQHWDTEVQCARAETSNCVIEVTDQVTPWWAAAILTLSVYSDPHAVLRSIAYGCRPTFLN